MLHFKLQSKASKRHIGTEIDRVVDMGKQSPVVTYETWIRRQERYRVVRHGEIFIAGGSIERGPTSPYLPLVGYPSGCHSNNSHQDLVVVRADSTLDRICGQIIFSEFMSSVVSEAVESIDGQVLVRGGDQWLKASLGLRNTVLDELASKLEETGFATADEAYLCIIPSLAINNKLPSQTDSAEKFIYKAKEVTAFLGGGRFEQAELVLWWLLDDTECEAKGLEATGQWGEACEAYARLWDAYDSIEGAEDFTEIAEEAMGLFCKRLYTHYKSNSEATMELLRRVNAQMGEAEGKLGEEKRNKCQAYLKELAEISGNV